MAKAKGMFDRMRESQKKRGDGAYDPRKEKHLDFGREDRGAEDVLNGERKGKLGRLPKGENAAN